jgi:hypothetical protein
MIQRGRPPDWRKRVIRELRDAAPAAAATLARQAKLGDGVAAAATLELLDRFEQEKPAAGVKGEPIP